MNPQVPTVPAVMRMVCLFANSFVLFADRDMVEWNGRDLVRIRLGEFKDVVLRRNLVQRSWECAS